MVVICFGVGAHQKSKTDVATATGPSKLNRERNREKHQMTYERGLCDSSNNYVLGRKNRTALVKALHIQTYLKGKEVHRSPYEADKEWDDEIDFTGRR